METPQGIKVSYDQGKNVNLIKLDYWSLLPCTKSSSGDTDLLPAASWGKCLIALSDLHY